MIKKLCLVLAVLIFSGCVHKGYLSDEPILVNFRMKDYKIEDYGFLKADKDAALLNVYHSGTPILQIETNADVVCIDTKCLSSSDFTKDFICPNLPKDSLLHILKAKPISSLPILNNAFGFTQEEPACKFVYRVEDRGIKVNTPNFSLSLQGTHDAN